MNLLEIERAMATAVMRPLTSRYGMKRKTAEGESVADEAALFIKPNRRLDSFERLEIYNRQYWFRILSALSEDFPALRATVGSKQFDVLIRAYLEQNPSRSFTLRNLGSNIENWLRSNPKSAGPRHAVALDVARLEWAYIEAFDNAQEPALTLADLAELGADSCLSLQPHVRLLELDFPVDDFIIEVHRKQLSSGVASNAVTGAAKSSPQKRLRAMRRSPASLAVHRFENAVYYKRLEPEAYRALRSLKNNRPLGDAIEEAFRKSHIPILERPGTVRQWFMSWAELGWFCCHRKVKTQPRVRTESQGRKKK